MQTYIVFAKDMEGDHDWVAVEANSELDACHQVLADVPTVALGIKWIHAVKKDDATSFTVEVSSRLVEEEV